MQKQRIASRTFLDSIVVVAALLCLVVCSITSSFCIFRDSWNFLFFSRGLLLLPSFNFFFLHDYGEFASTWVIDGTCYQERIARYQSTWHSATAAFFIHSGFGWPVPRRQTIAIFTWFFFHLLRTDNHSAANLFRDLHVSSRWRINLNWVWSNTIKKEKKKITSREKCTRSECREKLYRCFGFRVVSNWKPLVGVRFRAREVWILLIFVSQRGMKKLLTMEKHIWS